MPASTFSEAWSQVRGGDPRARAPLDRLVAILAKDPGGGQTVRLEIGFPQALLAIAAVHEELGDFPGALETLDRVPFTAVQEYVGTLWRERGRLASMPGDSARAIREYQRWLKLHVEAEASMKPGVTAVRAEVDRLAGGRPGGLTS